jgi:hypothetical protein
MDELAHRGTRHGHRAARRVRERQRCTRHTEAKARRLPSRAAAALKASAPASQAAHEPGTESVGGRAPSLKGSRRACAVRSKDSQKTASSIQSGGGCTTRQHAPRRTASAYAAPYGCRNVAVWLLTKEGASPRWIQTARCGCGGIDATVRRAVQAELACCVAARSEEAVGVGGARTCCAGCLATVILLQACRNQKVRTQRDTELRPTMCTKASVRVGTSRQGGHASIVGHRWVTACHLTRVREYDEKRGNSQLISLFPLSSPAMRSKSGRIPPAGPPHRTSKANGTLAEPGVSTSLSGLAVVAARQHRASVRYHRALTRAGRLPIHRAIGY